MESKRALSESVTDERTVETPENMEIEKSGEEELDTNDTQWESVKKSRWEMCNKIKTIKKRKMNWWEHYLCRDCILRDATDSMIKQQRGRGRRQNQLLDRIKENKCLRQSMGWMNRTLEDL